MSMKPTVWRHVEAVVGHSVLAFYASLCFYAAQEFSFKSNARAEQCAKAALGGVVLSCAGLAISDPGVLSTPSPNPTHTF